MRCSRPRVMRSKLFVPASSPALFQKALASDADAICFDLEDAVLPERKAEARSYLREFLASGFHTSKTILVRVNHVRSAYFAEDLTAVTYPVVSALVLPKVDDPAETRDVAEALPALEKERGAKGRIGLYATIESPCGLRLARDIAEGNDRIEGLQLGLADLFEPLGIQRSERWVAYQVRFQLRLAAGEAGIPCFDSAFANFKDEDGFVREAVEARSLGFDGKSCIHPGQIAAANRIFSPSTDEIAVSIRIVEAARQASAAGSGAFAFDGRMIDEPFIRRAEAIVQRAEIIRTMERDKEKTH
jgi:citrate lyase subunit beta/citryl-CoA lyase